MNYVSLFKGVLSEIAPELAVPFHRPSDSSGQCFTSSPWLKRRPAGSVVSEISTTYNIMVCFIRVKNLQR